MARHFTAHTLIGGTDGCLDFLWNGDDITVDLANGDLATVITADYVLTYIYNASNNNTSNPEVAGKVHVIVPDSNATGTGAWILSKDHIVNDIEQGFNHAYISAYKELGYTAGDLTSVNIWTDNVKTTKLYTKTLTYTTGNLTRIDTTDEISSITLRKDLVYDGNNDLQTVTTTWV